MGGQAGEWKTEVKGKTLTEPPEHLLTLCCLQERRKQQRRLLDAQQIQQEVSQLR